MMCRGVQQILATHRALAAILADGSVIAWGDVDRGGDISPVRDQLKGVQQIQATLYAFAAILANGSVVTWGCAGYGGDGSTVRQFEISSGSFSLPVLVDRNHKGHQTSPRNVVTRRNQDFGSWHHMQDLLHYEIWSQLE